MIVGPFGNFVSTNTTATSGTAFPVSDALGGGGLLTSIDLPYSITGQEDVIYANCGPTGFYLSVVGGSGGTAANIAFAGTNTIANGATSGVTIQFAFSGGSGSGAPSSFTFSVSSGSIDISQGLLFSTDPSITSSTIATPPSGQSQAGFLVIGWMGFNNGTSNPSTIQQAWGISSNSPSPPNSTASPLILSGTPPNQIFYPTTNSGATYFYYIGIPKMITPNY
jgi:hypothetical protein